MNARTGRRSIAWLTTCVLAALALQDVAAAGIGDADALIAFCRPGRGSAASAPCLCSVEQVEDLVTPGRLLEHLRRHHAAGAASAAELRLAVQQVHAVCTAPETDAVVATPALAPARPAAGPR